MFYRQTVSIAAFVLLYSLPLHGEAAVFGGDDRTPYDDASVYLREGLLNSTGVITCLDGTTGTGFVVDITDYIEGAQDFQVIATAAHVLYDEWTGESRGRCAFRPASLPDKYLEIDERLVGATRLKDVDSNDWAFARTDKPNDAYAAMRFVSESRNDFGAPSDSQLWAVGFVKEWGSLSVASGCKPDDRPLYPALLRQKDELAHMIIHDCDVLGSSRGGPLAIRKNEEFQAIAINSGGGGTKYEDLKGIPYDPKRNFYNHSRRFDKELEEKLIAFVSRFAHIRNPSPGIKARRELVRKIQSNLDRLGYDAGPIDGLKGHKTKDAIQAFQTTLGITPTGRVSEELLLLLKAR
jgi:hypothetical protein